MADVGIAAEIQAAARRYRSLLDHQAEVAADIKELLLEFKCASLPVKAIKDLVRAEMKDKLGKLRDETTDLITTAPVLGIDLGILPEGAQREIAESGTAQMSEAAE